MISSPFDIVKIVLIFTATFEKEKRKIYSVT